MYYPTKREAENEIETARKLNDGGWIQHSKNVAFACKRIAEFSFGLNADKAYVLGLMHDIGKRVEKEGCSHIIEGYNYCNSNIWGDVAKICITHSYLIKEITSHREHSRLKEEDYNFLTEYLKNVCYDDYDRLVQFCDAISLSTGICTIEEKFNRNCNEGNQFVQEKWDVLKGLKGYYESKIGGSVYDVIY